MTDQTQAPLRQLTEAEAVDLLCNAMLTVGRLLPVGLELFFFREGGDPRPRIQIVEPDGASCEYAFNTHAPAELVPVIGALRTHTTEG